MEGQGSIRDSLSKDIIRLLVFFPTSTRNTPSFAGCFKADDKSGKLLYPYPGLNLSSLLKFKLRPYLSSVEIS